ncbi:hypothetical protein [Thiocystis violacea]|uniref:hypothetical protein n=1 Tax=Thiocystis violacea TaxID=13725 RepID=UPI0019046950|nr:hypothetical protein [Thiocystis violacea]MBK1716847.1 hypothetical protein [Thiocystis violacea]
MTDERTAQLIDAALAEGRLAGPQTAAWLREIKPERARAYLSQHATTVVNRLRAEFPPDTDGETSFRAYQKAAARGDVRVIGGAA